MTITLNLEKAKEFALKHKEAIAVAVVASLLTHRLRKDLQSTSNYIVSKGLYEDYCNQTR